MKKIFSIVLLLSSLTYLGACQNENNASQSRGIKETISVDQFEKKLAETPGAQLIDVRTAEEYADGHLKNSVNMNVNREDHKQMYATLDKNKPVFVYCKAGSRSARAASIMQDMGFREIYNLDGGIMSWDNAGKPIENGSAPKPAGMTANDFNKLVAVKNYVLVDYNAQWCAPCKKMMPVLESLVQKKKDKLTLLKIDADDNKALLKEKGIAGIPYLELYLDGKLVWKHDGFIEEQQLLEEIPLNP